MCGIAGFLDPSFQSGTHELQARVMRMADTLQHRGPDDRGEWVEAKVGIAIAHRRLSIVDLSPHGHQPMVSSCGRFVLAFNGEIYNFRALRQTLETLKHPFHGHCDTEVILASIRQWGLDAAVKMFIGMFAFALWDRSKRLLHLVRDRLGIKPMYYGWVNGVFLFGSELKALRAHPGFNGQIDRNALSLYLRHNYVPSPYSIYEGIYKLMPGTLLALNTLNLRSDPTLTRYWSVREVAEYGVANPFLGSIEEATVHLDALLTDAVRLRMEADVPVGAFLSGGIDSSAVVALMQAQSGRPIRTFTIGFDDADYNEAQYAKAVARHLGTNHTELYVTPKDAMAVITSLPTLYDEPFSDSSQIPTFLISQLARQQVLVSLSGDGGDELFAGYTRYFLGRSIWQKVGWMPQWLRSMTATALTSLSPQAWNNMIGKIEGTLPGGIRLSMLGDKLHKLAEIMAVGEPESMYLGLISHWKNPNSLVLGACEPLTAITDSRQWADLPDFTQRMMYLDAVAYLPDDILVKLDRASMAVSLEARVPLLDHRVVEFAWQVPLSMKIRNGQGKWLLRQVLYKYVPKELIERPKMGFGIPIDVWLRGPLRGWAEELLDEKRLREEGLLCPAPIRKKWDEHLSGVRNWHYYLWDILMFQAWKEQWT